MRKVGVAVPRSVYLSRVARCKIEGGNHLLRKGDVVVLQQQQEDIGLSFSEVRLDERIILTHLRLTEQLNATVWQARLGQIHGPPEHGDRCFGGRMAKT